VRVLNRNNVGVECMCVCLRIMCVLTYFKKSLDVYNKKMCVYVFACVCTCCLEASAGVLCLFSPISTSSSITMSTRPNCAVAVIKSMRLASYCSTTTKHASLRSFFDIHHLTLIQRAILHYVLIHGIYSTQHFRRGSMRCLRYRKGLQCPKETCKRWTG